MSHVRLALVFKDFAAWLRSSCVGLNVAGYAAAKVLREAGIDTVVFPVRNNVDLVHDIDKYNETHPHPLTHVVISAPWLSAHDLKSLVSTFRSIKFAVLSHSNVGFLQADPNGVWLLRKYLEIAKDHHNLLIGGNSYKFVEWLRAAYGDEKAVLLPNLYSTKWCREPKHWEGGTLRIGAFGAMRPYKNFMTAAGATVILQRQLNVPIEFHMSGGGEDTGQILPAIEQIFGDTDVKLMMHPWQYWDDFIKLIGEMDILMQPSYTESFNMVTADGIRMGVPSVVSTAINWAPESWKADSDDSTDVARVAAYLLKTHEGEGQDALEAHNCESLKYWFRFLGLEKPSLFDRVKKFIGD
jgi:hypothetical protein